MTEVPRFNSASLEINWETCIIIISQRYRGIFVCEGNVQEPYMRLQRYREILGCKVSDKRNS